MPELLDDVSKQADALGQAIKDNQTEISKLQSIHDRFEAQWFKEKSEIDEIVLQGNSLVSQLCVLEEDRNRRQMKVAALENEIDKARNKYEATRKSVLDKITEYEDMKREISEYEFKMKTYTNGVTEVESNTPLLQQVATVKQDIETLKSKKLELDEYQLGMMKTEAGSVMTKAQLELEILEIKQQIEERNDAHGDKKRLLESTQEKRKGLKMTQFVLTKKNSALLIRMKRKVEEQKEKYSSFVSQRDYLAKMIDTTNRKLDRFGESS